MEAKKVKKVYNAEHKESEANSKNLPAYVMVEKIALRYIEEYDEYFRDAGYWAINYTVDEDGKIFADCEDVPNLHGKELKPITFARWHHANLGYV